MTDEQTILACGALFVLALLGFTFTLGAAWGTARSERRLRTPRLVRLDVCDTVERL